MNPFSGFLQPPAQRPIDSGVSITDLSRLKLARQQEANRVAEAGRDNTRADQYLKLQQTDQSSRLTQQDQKQVESLLAEYQDAEDQGDPVRLSRAAQMLKRFGMDVAQPSQPQALPGQLPFVNPIDEAVQTEQQSRAALRARNAQPEADLSQGDFEEQFINSASASPGRYEKDRQTTEESRSALPQAPDDEPVDLGDVDSPEFKQAAEQEARPELANTAPQLAGQTLPTVISRGGKKLYESTGPSGRWTPMVKGAFELLLGHENPDIAAAAQRGQSIAAKLIEVDGLAPKDAIKMGMDYIQSEAGRLTKLELKPRPKWSGGGGGSTSMYTGGATGKLDAALNDDADKVRTMWVNSAGYKKMQEQAGLLDEATAGLLSPDGMSQNQAVSTLKRIQSGLTLNAQEMADFKNAVGAMEGIKKDFERYLGKGELPEEYKRQTMNVVERMRGVITRRMQRGAEEAYLYWMKTRGRAGAPEVVREKGEAIRDSLKGEAGGEVSPSTDEYGGL